MGGSESTILDCGVKDVHGGLSDSDLGGVIHAERDRQRERKVNHLVGDSFLKVKGVGTHDVSCCEGRARAVACWDLVGGGINEADKGVGDFDRSILYTWEPGVIVVMTDEVIEFDSHFGVGGGATLWLEDGADALLGRHHIETSKEVVVRQHNDAFCGGEQLLEASIECYCIVTAHPVQCEERVW